MNRRKRRLARSPTRYQRYEAPQEFPRSRLARLERATALVNTLSRVRREIVHRSKLLDVRRPEVVRSRIIESRLRRPVKKMHVSAVVAHLKHGTVRATLSCMKDKLESFRSRSGTSSRKSRSREKSRRQLFAVARRTC